ncbi:hypothetical protein KSI01_03750 [Kurthia sibirica]|nr:hypothetical protein KSI01_03750 [Kurthia sibirica]
MAIKSINLNRTVWSLIALVLGMISIIYCMQAVWIQYDCSFTVIFAKLKMLGAV